MILLELFWTLFKIGALTFGGGYAMLPLIQAEVERHGWMDAESLVNFIAVSESTPGPFAVNISTYVGIERAGLSGAACATLGVVLPSFVIILLVARFFDQFRSSRVVRGCMSGLKPAVIGMIATAVLSVGKTVFWPFDPVQTLCSLGIFAISMVLVMRKKHPIVIILLSAALGIALGYLI